MLHSGVFVFACKNAEKLHAAGITTFTLAEPPEESGEDRVKSKERAKRTYSQSVAVTKDLMTSVRIGKSPSIKKIKRLYVYTWFGGVTSRFDAGLVANGKPRKSYAEVRKHMFVFEDIKSLDDRSMQRLMRDVNTKDLSMALRNSSEELKARVFKNMSSRAAQTLRDDMNVAGPVRLRLVEEAQQRIINTVRALQEFEEIIVSRGDQDVMI